MKPLCRRSVLQFGALSAVTGVAGCSINVNTPGNGDRNPTLRVYPGVEQKGDSWKMNLRVRHKSDNIASIHDVTVVAFGEHGQETCYIEVGDFPQGGRYEVDETVPCDSFPAIVTAIAEESPCDGANIRMLYYTSKKDPATVDDLTNHSLWEGRWRECDEDLPPEHVVEEVRQSGAAMDEE